MGSPVHAADWSDRQRRYRKRAERTAGAFQERLSDIPLALPQMCCSLFMTAAGHLRQVIIAGKAGQQDTQALLEATYSSFTPDKVQLHPAIMEPSLELLVADPAFEKRRVL